MDRSAGRLVLTVGLHGSASTWVFNVAREVLTAAYGADAVAGAFAASAADVAAARRPGVHLVVKTHGWPDIADFAAAEQAVMLISVRDPRDAVLSLMQRFGDPLDVAVPGVGRDCQAARAAAGAGHPVLRYEDGFFADPATVAWLAAQLGLAPPEAMQAAIFERWHTAAVRARADAIPLLPAGERSDPAARVMLERRTLVTAGHIGDGRVGKWRDGFDPETRQRMTAFFARFLLRFGYPLG